MEIRPKMDIRFPSKRELELLEAMKSKVKELDLWQWQPHDPHGRPPESGKFYFHRGESNGEPPCTLCIRRQELGHFIVQSVVPDANTVNKIPIDQYVHILTEFDNLIAVPVAEALSGMTAIGTSKHTLNDYFSNEAVLLLEHFCTTSNGDGSHPADQDKWFAFLLYVYRNKEDVHCDIFGACLCETRWWPNDGISKLVNEYDFALQLLRKSEKQGQHRA